MRTKQGPGLDICAILMLKNENRYIKYEDGTLPPYTMLEQNLRRLSSLVDEVYIVDNSSDDGSNKVYEKYHDELVKFIQYNPDDWKFDDVRDRKILLKQAQERNMKWLLVVDGDEIYEDAANLWIHKFCKDNKWTDMYTIKFHYINFWRGRLNYRVDAWNNSWFPRLFSMHQLTLEGEALHNYAFGFNTKSGFSRGTIIDAPVKCLHYGWADWEHRVEKTQRYMKRDMELTGINYDQAKAKYSNDINEKGLILKKANELWGSEFRNKGIDY